MSVLVNTNSTSKDSTVLNYYMREDIKEIGVEKIMDPPIELKSYAIRGYSFSPYNNEMIDEIVSIHKKLKEIRDASPS